MLVTDGRFGVVLIAKRAHTIATLSALHDRIMTRYYKFLVVNVLVFFCVGIVALQSFLLSFKSVASSKVLSVIAQSFPVAAPFYVGWCKCVRLLAPSTPAHACIV